MDVDELDTLMKPGEFSNNTSSKLVPEVSQESQDEPQNEFPILLEFENMRLDFSEAF